MNHPIRTPKKGSEMKPDRRECSEFYAKVVVTCGAYRVIECSDGIQWILQRRTGAKTRLETAWRSLGFHTTRDSLERLWRSKTGVAHDAIRNLPDRFPGSGSG